MKPTVVVIGGGYGGATAAKRLDDVADVALVEPRETFVHNVAALRGVVDPAWADRLFLPYDKLLEHGRVIQDRAVRVSAGVVELGGGERLTTDYLILATGSTYPFPAKMDVDNSAGAKAKLRDTHKALSAADSVLLLGAGPVGLELAGEIASAWDDKDITIVDPADDILAGAFSEAFRDELRAQLEALGIRLILGTALRDDPPSAAGKLANFTTATETSSSIAADIWFRCFGGKPNTDYLTEDLATAPRDDDRVEVTDRLNVAGHDNVFALGDITSLPEAKTAKAAELHAEVVATNIRALIDGSRDLTTYEAQPPAISLPLGPTGGASYAPDLGVLDAQTTSRLKGTHLRMDRYTELLGLT